jgi:putative tricarboxylic transport membrane protein
LELFNGFMGALAPHNLMYGLLGAVLGTIVGILPGLGPTATLAILLPVTYKAPVDATLILMAGLFYGAMYGGSTTSILLNLPGEAASVVTAIDGHEMAKQGRAGAALGISAIGSFVAGTVGLIGLSLAAPPLARAALRFGPPEYTMLTALGLILVIFMVSGNPLKATVSALFGLLLAAVGTDPVTGVPRFSFGSLFLMDGFDFAAIAMGLFGIGEILYNIAHPEQSGLITDKVTNLWPTAKDWAQSRWAILRGSLIGFFAGLLPGGGPVIASLISYATEKKLAKDPSRFGKGAIEGVAGPESANNAASSACFIPLLALGIPANATMALVYGALLMHGLRPGPNFIHENGGLFWTVVASMYIGNVILVALNLPLVGVLAKILKVPAQVIAPLAILLTLVGAYSIANSIFNVFVVVIAGIIGYLMREHQFDVGPAVLAFVLGPIFETSFRQSLLMSYGSLSIFYDRGVARVLLLLLVGIIVMQAATRIRKFRPRATKVDGAPHTGV